MKQHLNILFFSVLVLISFSSCSGSKHPSVKTLYIDYLARQDVKNEKHEDALAKYYSLLEDDGERSATHSNIGVLLNGMQKSEDSLKSLQYALKLAEDTGDKEMIFKVRYNLGVYYGSLKKIPEALENYQMALDIMPTSNEIKTNIELLIQQQQQQQQNQKKQGEQGDQKQDQQPNSGQDENKDKKQSGDQKDKKDGQDDKENKEDQKKESSAKYQPRPFKGDQLSEGDVKKILGELKNQEQKIRANFDKKEKGKSKNNEKDW